MMETFTDRFVRVIRAKCSILIVGLDPQLKLIPRHLLQQGRERMVECGISQWEAIGWVIFEFNKAIIDATHKYAAAYKLQMAFYEKYGMWGLWAFERTVAYARRAGMLIIEDAKRGDGGDTAEAYADGHLGEVEVLGDPEGTDLLSYKRSPIRVDCMTIHGYIADACVDPFVKRVQDYGTGIFVVDKTSFTPNSKIEQLVTQSGLKVWQELAELVKGWGEGTEGQDGYRNVGVVMGATYPEDAPWMRKLLPNAWFLIPGYGGQGATADDAVVGINKDGLGGGVNSSRAIIFAYNKGPFACAPEHFALAAGNAAKASRDELNYALRRADKLAFML